MILILIHVLLFVVFFKLYLSGKLGIKKDMPHWHNTPFICRKLCKYKNKIYLLCRKNNKKSCYGKGGLLDSLGPYPENGKVFNKFVEKFKKRG